MPGPQPDEPLLGRSRPIRSHGARKRRVPIPLIIAIILGLVAIGAGLRFVPGSPFAASRSDDAASAPLPFHSAAVTAEDVKTSGFLSWALLDRRTGTISGSETMAQSSTTARMVTAWFAADYLNQTEATGQSPTKAQQDDVTAMIRDSDDKAAERIFQAVGGGASVQRLIDTCKLTEARTAGTQWLDTVISARDAVRMGACLADGTAAGPKWTPWLLDTLRSVRNTGDFGIREALPEAARPGIAIINGWQKAADKTWHVNCLAIGTNWVISVLQRYPATGNDAADLTHTHQVCQDTASALRDDSVPLS